MTEIKQIDLKLTVGLITPSSPMQPGRLEIGIRYLESIGCKVKLGKHIHESSRFLAGSDKDRAQDIMDFYLDTEIDVLMATGGGYGSQRILPYLDFEIIRKNPKPISGFSDTTALQSGLISTANVVSYSGFIFKSLDDCVLDPLIDKTLKACLAKTPFEIAQGQCVNPGIAQGKLIGGNLGCLMSLIGTQFQPDFHGAILLLEEVRTEPYKIDAMISHLHLAGVFEQISALIFGEFEQCDAHYFPERDGTVDDIINEWAKKIAKPCIKDFPYGHGDKGCVLPIGKDVMLNADVCMLQIP